MWPLRLRYRRTFWINISHHFRLFYPNLRKTYLFSFFLLLYFVIFVQHAIFLFLDWHLIFLFNNSVDLVKVQPKVEPLDAPAHLSWMARGLLWIYSSQCTLLRTLTSLLRWNLTHCFIIIGSCWQTCIILLKHHEQVGTDRHRHRVTQWRHTIRWLKRFLLYKVVILLRFSDLVYILNNSFLFIFFLLSCNVVMILLLSSFLKSFLGYLCSTRWIVLYNYFAFVSYFEAEGLLLQGHDFLLCRTFFLIRLFDAQFGKN